MFLLMISPMSLKMGHVGSKIRSPGQIFEQILCMFLRPYFQSSTVESWSQRLS